MLEAAVGLMEVLISPLLDGMVWAISLVLKLLIGIVDVVMSLFCSVFSDGFIIGEGMFTEGIYRALTDGYIYRSIQTTALAAMLIIAFWQIFKTFFAFMGLNGEIEEPWKIAIKTIIFGILIIYSKDICEEILKTAGKVLAEILKVNIGVNNGTVQKLEIAESVHVAVDCIGLTLKNSNAVMIISKFLVIVYIDWKIMGFMFNIAQKYLNMMVYVALAPIAFACGVSRATSDILSSWARLFAGGIAIQGIQFILLKLINIYGELMRGIAKEDWTILFIYFSLGAIITKLEDILEEVGLPGGVRFNIVSSMMETINLVNSIKDMGKSAYSLKKGKAK